MANPKYYIGPGKVFFGGLGLQAQGENGQINMAIQETTDEVATGQFGYQGETLADELGRITVTPFDNWSLMPLLYPTFLGITTAGGAGQLAIGSQAHGAANVPAEVWTVDGRLYDFVRAAIVKHPDLNLGVGVPLFGNIEILALGDPTKKPGDAGFLMAGNAITENAANDPGGAMTMADFVRGAWTGVWGAVSGFGGGAGDVPIQAEDKWTISVAARYSVISVQRVSQVAKLDSVQISARVRPFGPSQSQIMTQIGTHKSGQLLGSANLTLTGPLAKTITLVNAEVRGGNFEVGGTKLGTGEIAFVMNRSFNAGAAQPGMIISA